MLVSRCLFLSLLCAGHHQHTPADDDAAEADGFSDSRLGGDQLVRATPVSWWKQRQLPTQGGSRWSTYISIHRFLRKVRWSARCARSASVVSPKYTIACPVGRPSECVMRSTGGFSRSSSNSLKEEKNWTNCSLVVSKGNPLSRRRGFKKLPIWVTVDIGSQLRLFYLLIVIKLSYMSWVVKY